MSDPATRTCTAYWRTRDGALEPWAMCGELALYEVADTFVCDHHYQRALQWAETAARRLVETVYYVRRADGMIKVGTSRKAASRLAGLAHEHGQLTLMAIHAGGHKEESDVHRKFRELHVGGEWFHPELPLLQHIARVRKTTGNLEREGDGLPPRMSAAALGRLIRDAKERWADWEPPQLRSRLRSRNRPGWKSEGHGPAFPLASGARSEGLEPPAF